MTTDFSMDEFFFDFAVTFAFEPAAAFFLGFVCFGLFFEVFFLMVTSAITYGICNSGAITFGTDLYGHEFQHMLFTGRVFKLALVRL